jgi:hypothetical protein
VTDPAVLSGRQVKVSRRSAAQRSIDVTAARRVLRMGTVERHAVSTFCVAA